MRHRLSSSCCSLAFAGAIAFPAVHGDTESCATLEVLAEGTLVLEVDTDRAFQSSGIDLPDGTLWTVPQVAKAEVRILEHLAEQYHLSRDGRELSLHPVRLDPILGLDPMVGAERVHRVTAHFTFDAQSGDQRIEITQNLFEAQEGAHRHVVRFLPEDAAAEPLAIVLPGRPTAFELEDPTPAGREQRLLRHARRALREGAWLLPLLAVLCLAGGGLRAGPRPQLGLSALALCGVALGTALLAGRFALGPSPFAVRVTSVLAVLYLGAENLFARDLRLSAATSGLFGIVYGLALLEAWNRTVPLPRHDGTACTLVYLSTALAVPALASLPARWISRWVRGGSGAARFVVLHTVLAVAAVTAGVLGPR